MDSFEAELMRRSPLAACVLEMSDFVFEDALMESIWGEHRGRCYQDVLKFPDLLRLMRDALVNHGGSAHRLFVSLERRAAQPVEESNFYRKLSRTPVEISRALLRQCTARLAGLMPPGAAGAAGAAGGGGGLAGLPRRLHRDRRRRQEDQERGQAAGPHARVLGQACWGPRRWWGWTCGAGWRWR